MGYTEGIFINVGKHGLTKIGERSMEEKTVGVRMGIDLLKEIDAIGEEMHLNRSSILILACREFVERRNNPDKIKEQIRQALHDDPTLLDEPLKRIGFSLHIK